MGEPISVPTLQPRTRRNLMAKNKMPFHLHALSKASAKHLHKAGHIKSDHYKKIVAHAERGMKANPRVPNVPQYEGSPQDEAEDAAGESAIQPMPPMMGKRK